MAQLAREQPKLVQAQLAFDMRRKKKKADDAGLPPSPVAVPHRRL
jgi:hypothetical protein